MNETPTWAQVFFTVVLQNTSAIRELFLWLENSVFHPYISLGRYLFSLGALYRLTS